MRAGYLQLAIVDSVGLIIAPVTLDFTWFALLPLAAVLVLLLLVVLVLVLINTPNTTIDTSTTVPRN